MVQVSRLQRYMRENARQSAEVFAIPPFTLFLRVSETSEREGVALPDHPIEAEIIEVEIDEALHQLERSCAARDCRAQIQFLREFAPKLPLALQSAGYVEIERLPLLICTPESYRDAEPVAGLEMVTITRDSPIEEIKEGWDANALGFDPEAALATDEQAEVFRQTLEGCLAFTARLDGHAAGAGMFNPIRDGITEVVGITTLVPFRRRGIATFLTAFATEAAFKFGAEIVFLVPGNEQAHRIYERIGYRMAANRLIYQGSVHRT